MPIDSSGLSLICMMYCVESSMASQMLFHMKELQFRIYLHNLVQVSESLHIQSNTMNLEFETSGVEILPF